MKYHHRYFKLHSLVCMQIYTYRHRYVCMSALGFFCRFYGISLLHHCQSSKSTLRGSGLTMQESPLPKDSKSRVPGKTKADRQRKRDKETTRGCKPSWEAKLSAHSGAAFWPTRCQVSTTTPSAYGTKASRQGFQHCFENRWQRSCVGFSGDLPTLKGKHVKTRKGFAF